MASLSNKLASLDGQSYPSDIKHLFQEVATDLLCNYHIRKGAQTYYFSEIEFYFCNQHHPDIITYPRRLKSGNWYFHQSGIDLTFNSDYASCNDSNGVDTDQEFYYGGILLRQIVTQGSWEVIDGPYKCEWELFDKFNAFKPSDDEVPMIVQNESSLALPIIQKTRQFSYNEVQMNKKFEFLKEKIYCGKLDLTYDKFRRFITEEPYAYSVKNKELIQILKQ